MNDAPPRSAEEVISDVIANAYALGVMAEGWLPVEQWSGNVTAANGTVIELTRLVNELKRIRHGR